MLEIFVIIEGSWRERKCERKREWNEGYQAPRYSGFGANARNIAGPSARHPRFLGVFSIVFTDRI